MELKVESKECVASIQGPDKVLEEVLCSDFLYNHIPMAREVREKKCDVNVTLEVGEFSCNFEYPNAEYHNPVLNPNDVIALTGYLLERARQEKGVYGLHANAVDINGKGIVVFGPPHSGKSTLSLTIAKLSGGKVVSDNICLITPDKCAEGEILSLSLNRFVAKYIRQSEVPGLVGSGKPEIVMFVHPLVSQPAELIPYTDIEAIVWDLIDQTDVIIRGINCSVKMGDSKRYLLPSLDTKNLAQERYSFFRDLFEKGMVWCYSAIGSFDEMASMVLEEFKVRS